MKQAILLMDTSGGPEWGLGIMIEECDHVLCNMSASGPNKGTWKGRQRKPLISLNLGLGEDLEIISMIKKEWKCFQWFKIPKIQNY